MALPLMRSIRSMWAASQTDVDRELQDVSHLRGGERGPKHFGRTRSDGTYIFLTCRYGEPEMETLRAFEQFLHQGFDPMDPSALLIGMGLTSLASQRGTPGHSYAVFVGAGRRELARSMHPDSHPKVTRSPLSGTEKMLAVREKQTEINFSLGRKRLSQLFTAVVQEIPDYILLGGVE
ncbi:uncharacterized protein CIMG_12144 [Coccidioides immitis RS]|uniref:Uncharacterized protein n=1 Tax=Coccidioides immitis (strain RS) TaxID=246410 RepID=A0A0D8JU25_COCIM|nr:uncharacterized protein CIMG_12144 [Coccidioides immitis RS]KJF60792.1 hypothetical protein CIMG_12144 [Coccidioides immitis RS]